MMKREFFPTDGPFPWKHGTVINWPDQYATAADAVAGGARVLGYLHGKGVADQGKGTLKELTELVGMAMFSNGFWQAIDKKNIVIAMVQTDTGYAAGEIQFLLAKIKDELKPKLKPALMGYSWGGFGIINNIDSGALDPAEFSSYQLLSAGGDGNIGKNFASRMKGKKVPVYLYHNMNDKTAKVAQSQYIFDQLKIVGEPVAFIKYLNVWRSSDGNTLSHGSVGMVFPSWEWRSYATDPATRTSPKFAEVSASNNITLGYDAYQIAIDNAGEIDPPVVVDPPPPADVVIDSFSISADVSIIKKADGSIGHTITLK